MSLIPLLRLPILGRDSMGADKNIAVQGLVLQIGWLVVVSVIDVLLHTTQVTFAFSMGCISAVVPQLIFGIWAFRAQGARSARKILGYFFVGEALKLVVAGTLVSAVLMSQQFPSVTVIAGFMSTVILGQVVVPFLMNARHLR